MVKGPRSESEQEDGQTDGEKWHVQAFFDVSGATSPSCTVTQAIRNVHDQPESINARPAVENLLRPVEFKTILQPRILDNWHQLSAWILSLSEEGVYAETSEKFYLSSVLVTHLCL